MRVPVRASPAADKSSSERSLRSTQTARAFDEKRSYSIMTDPLHQRTFSSRRQTTRYIECGPADGPLMIFVHGWPSISLMWRAQMDAFAADGWRCVAPDLRGYGGSSAPAGDGAYSIRDAVDETENTHKN